MTASHGRSYGTMDRNGTQSVRQSPFSIRTVLISLGALSVLTAAVLAGLGLLGIQRQLDARERVVVLGSRDKVLAG
jgi:hypothetical protein